MHLFMTYSCRYLLIVVVVLFGLSSEANDQPNVIVIVADDQGYGDTDAFWPDSAIRTPRLIELAEEGIKLTNFRTQPLCTPTRAAIMTGLFNSGYNQKGSEHLHGVDHRLTFLSEYLRRMGYQVGGFGKWHLDSHDGNHPLDRGFHHWVGFHGGDMPYHFPAGRSHVFDGKRPYEKPWKHSTDLFADEAIAFIRENRARPFFVYLAFNAVHTPLWSKENPIYSSRADWLARIRSRGIDDPAIADYRAVVEHMDDRVGDVLDELKKYGLERKTLIIYLSDNGAITPDHFPHFPQQGSNGPYRGGKASPYEGGIRVPFVASWPGVIPAGSQSDQPSLDADILPTVLDAAGIIRLPENNGPRKTDGRSLLGLFKAPDTVQLAERGTPSWLGSCFAYVKYPWKLLTITNKVGLEGAQGLDVTNGRLLFNLASDPGETTDLAPQNPRLANELWGEYQDLFYANRKPLHPDHNIQPPAVEK